LQHLQQILTQYLIFYCPHHGLRVSFGKQEAHRLLVELLKIKTHADGHNQFCVAKYALLRYIHKNIARFDNKGQKKWQYFLQKICVHHIKAVPLPPILHYWEWKGTEGER
jgi:hypothetical protein